MKILMAEALVVKFHNLKIKKETAQDVVEQLRADVQKTVDMQKKMRNGIWVHRDEIDILESKKQAVV